MAVSGESHEVEAKGAAYGVAGAILVFGSEVSALETAGQLGLVKSEIEWPCIPRALGLSRPG